MPTAALSQAALTKTKKRPAFSEVYEYNEKHHERTFALLFFNQVKQILAVLAQFGKAEGSPFARGRGHSPPSNVGRSRK